jgi:hypothetical protein
MGAQAASATTIGQLAPPNPPNTCVTSVYDYLSPTVTSGASYVVPPFHVTLTSWSTEARSAAGRTMALKVFRKVGDPHRYQLVGRDGPRTLSPGILNTFAVNLPVRAGDVIGVSSGNGNTACLINADASQRVLALDGGLNDGQSAQFGESTGYRPNITAVVKPPNTFTVGSATKNKKKGTASVDVTVPGPGTLALSGTGLQAQQAVGAGGLVAVKTVTGPGVAELLVKASGKKRKKLKRKGKARVSPQITYTPTGGDPNTQALELKLKKKK